MAALKYARLGLRFHQTFIPERNYIGALLRFAAEDGTGNDREIMEKTGIPTGKSSGKVPAVIKYSEGMNLVRTRGSAGNRRISLTPFGKSVLEENPTLSEPLTQWMLHLHLCRRKRGAEIWHQVFGPGRKILGHTFTRTLLDEYLSGLFGKRKRSLIGPLISTYTSEAALKGAGVLAEAGETITRSPAPIDAVHAPGHGAFLLSLWEAHFPDDRQVTLTDFEAETRWSLICGWNEAEIGEALASVAGTGAVEIDRQMHPWVINRREAAETLWRRLYSELV